MQDISQLWSLLAEDQSSTENTSQISDSFAEDRNIILHLGDSFDFLRTIPSGTANWIEPNLPHQNQSQHRIPWA
jgi:hypothetical protein